MTNLVNKFSTLGVVTLSPVVSRTRLSEDEVIRTKDVTVLAAFDGVQDSWLQIHQDSTGHVFSSL
jgi:hypothetical protein